MLERRRSRLSQLPLLTVLALATSLVAWAVVGSPAARVHAGAGVDATMAAVQSAPLRRTAQGTSDVPHITQRPSELLRELMALSLAETPGRDAAGLEQGLDPEGEPAAQARAARPAGGSVSRSSRRRGTLVNGLPEGPWELLYEGGGPMARGTFDEGLPDGPWSWWDEDGELALIGEFDDGLATGDWRGFHPGGTLALETSYRGGEQHGPRTEWTREGRTSVEGSHEEGLRSGLWVTYHEDGSVRMRGRYKNGLRDGRWNQWHPDGSPMMRGSYRRGRRDGDWTEWYSNGQLKEGGEFVNGRREGWWEFYLYDGTPDRRTGSYSKGRRQKR